MFHTITQLDLCMRHSLVLFSFKFAQSSSYSRQEVSATKERMDFKKRISKIGHVS
jgi:hypothetical protein